MSIDGSRVTLPVRSKQLVERDPEESLFAYHDRCWDAEFNRAMDGIRDTSVRNALFALRNLVR